MGSVCRACGHEWPDEGDLSAKDPNRHFYVSEAARILRTTRYKIDQMIENGELETETIRNGSHERTYVLRYSVMRLYERTRELQRAMDTMHPDTFARWYMDSQEADFREYCRQTGQTPGERPTAANWAEQAREELDRDRDANPGLEFFQKFGGGQ